MPFEDQAVAIYAGGNGYLDDIPVGDTTRFRAELLQYLKAQKPEILQSVHNEKKFTDETKAALNAAIESFKTQFAPTE
jgi:F-type H+-transporting ATPase subunit alpha